MILLATKKKKDLDRAGSRQESLGKLQGEKC